MENSDKAFGIVSKDLPSSLAKISPPRITGIVHRERLAKLLDRSMMKPVVWVSSPGGSGKTTVVADYLTARKLPCIWYQCDESDSDLASFFYHLGLAAKKAFPRQKRVFPLLTPEFLGGVTIFASRFFAEIFASVKSSAPIIFVLDNYQDAPLESPLHSILQGVFANLPDNAHVLVLSRNELPSPMVRLKVSEKISVIDYTSLSFNREETREMLSGRNLNHDEETLNMLFEKSRGWAAGIILLLESVKKAGKSNHAAVDFSQDRLFDYFAEEVFNRTEKKVQSFLLQTSFLPIISTGLAEKLTNENNAGKILAGLSRQHFFTERLAGSGQAYQYHPLFRDFLQSRAKASFSPKKMQALQIRAARLLEQSAQIEHAASLFADGNDWKSLSRIALSHGNSLLAEGRGSVLEGWLKRFPESEFLSSPHLVFLLGVCRMPYSSEEAITFLEKAFKDFSSAGDTNGALMACLAIMDSILMEGSDFTKLKKWIDWLDKIEETGFVFPTAEVELGVAAKMLFVTFYQPWHPRTIYWRGRAEELITRKINANLLVSAGTTMIIHYVFYGMMRKAAILLEKLRPFVVLENVLLINRIHWQMGEILYAVYGSSSPEEYLNPIDKGKDLSRQTGIRLFDRFFLYYEIIGSLISGNTAEAKQLLSQMGSPEYPAQDKSFHIIYLFMLTWKNLAIKEASFAVEQIRHTITEIENLGPSLVTIFNLIGLSHAQMKMNNRSEALKSLANARNMVQMESPLCQFMILFTEAYFAIKTGQLSEAAELTRIAMKIGREHGIMTFPYATHEVVASLCKKSLENEIELEYTKTLIKKHKLKLDAADPQLEAWPYPIKIHTLGRFEIFIDEKPLAFLRKAPKKPLEMLKTIIAFGCTNVPTDRIIDAMWPTADGDSACSSFKVNLHHLRKLLCFDEAILLSDGFVSLNFQLCLVDAIVFQQRADVVLAREAEFGVGDQKQEQNLANQAILLYKGNFVENEKSLPALTAFRERLRSRFIRLVDYSGTIYERQSDWSKAIALYEKAIETDEMQEDFYINLMQCYQKLEKFNAAFATYARYCRIVKDISGTLPSRRMTALYEKIVSLA